MKRLQTRLILAFLLVVLVVLCGVSAGLLLILQRSPEQQRMAYLALTTKAQALTELLLRTPRFNPERIEQQAEGFTQLARIARNQEVRIAWARADGRVIFDSNRQWEGARADRLLSELNRGLSGRRTGRIVDRGTVWLVVAQPYRPIQEPAPEGPLVTSEDDDDIQGYLILAEPAPTLAFIRRFRQSLLSPLLRAGLAALILGIALAALISHSIARPLNQVAQTTHEIASGNFEARAPEEGPEEVQDLARAFNHMVDHVQASREAQRNLVANIAHDLRTPLTSIQGFAQALIDGTAADPQAQHQAANAIYEESRRLHTMTSALLDLARFEAGQIELAQEPVNLEALVQRRLARFKPQAEDAGVALLLKKVAPPATILGDEGRLEQLLDNLLSNAIKHTPAEGRVTVEIASSSPSWTTLTVSDTGTGIPPEALSHIFERFYRGDRSRHGPGTGLGLAIAREIVIAHGGTIDVASTLDAGTTFRVKLPQNAHPTPR